MVGYLHLFKNFSLFLIHTVKGFSIVNDAEEDILPGFSCLFYDPADVGNLISGFSAFSQSSLYIWKLSVHILLKLSLMEIFFFAQFTSNIKPTIYTAISSPFTVPLSEKLVDLVFCYKKYINSTNFGYD